MIITVAALAIGLVIGLARGGRVRNLARRHLHWPIVGAAGIAGLLVTRWGGGEAPELLLATSLLLCAICAFRNVHIVGLIVVGIGLTLNLLPLLANGTVPVDPDALVDADLVEPADLDRVELGGGRDLADDDTMLPVLGERIPVPELGLVLSFGDLVIAMGLADAVYVSTRRRRPGGLPVAEIFAADERAEAAVAAARLIGQEDGVTIDLTGATVGRRRERPVEVSPGQPVPIPVGWGPVDDREPHDDRLVGAGAYGGGRPAEAHAGRPTSTTHVPWPWRRNPPPRPHHPTMRVTRR